MKDLGKLVAVIAAIVTIKRILDGGRACICMGRACVCTDR